MQIFRSFYFMTLFVKVMCIISTLNGQNKVWDDGIDPRLGGGIKIVLDFRVVCKFSSLFIL